jgi:DNA primase
MKYEKKDFREVVQALADRAGIEIPKDRQPNAEDERYAEYGKANKAALDFYRNFLLKDGTAEKARVYLKKRGITDETSAVFELGFAPAEWERFYGAVKGKIQDEGLEKLGLIVPKKSGDGYYDRFRDRLIFPILDAKGVCVAFGGRVLDDALPKYLNSPESGFYSKGRNLYGLYQAKKAIRENDAVIIVEGYMDLIACHQAGVRYVAASLGTALTSEQVRLIKRNTKNVFILYDADKAGEMATLRGLEMCLEESLDVKIVRLPQGHDPDSYIKQMGGERFKQALLGAKTLFEYKLSLLKAQFDARSVEGKVKIANEMVSLFSKVQNEILRSAWTKELAKELSLSEEALVAEMRKSIAKPKPSRIELEAPVSSSVSLTEKMMLGMMLDDRSFLSKAKEEVGLEDFHHPKAREIVKRIFESEAEELTAAKLVNFYEQDAESTHIISLACAEVETLTDKQKAFSDCVVQMKLSRIRNQRDELKSRIDAAQRDGDKDRMTKLLYDFNQLNKGMKQIHEKK